MKSSTIVQFLGFAGLGTAQTVDLGSAAAFGAMGPEGVTNTGATDVTGDVGTSGASVTGFPPGVFTGSMQVGTAIAITAQNDSAAAYLQGQALTPTVDEAGLTTLGGGQTLTSGVYSFDAAVTIAGTLTLSGSGTYVFQLSSTLTTASDAAIVVADGASGCDVYWIVKTGATLGTGTIFVGNILSGTAITLTTGASVSGGLYGGSAVTLDTNTILACDGTAGNTTSSSSSSSSVAPSTSSTAVSSTAPVTTSTTPATTSTKPASSSSSKTSTATKTSTESSTTLKTSTTSKKTTSTSSQKTTSTTSKKTTSTTSKKTTSTETPKPTPQPPQKTTSTPTPKPSPPPPPPPAPQCPDEWTNPIAYALCKLHL